MNYKAAKDLKTRATQVAEVIKAEISETYYVDEYKVTIFLQNGHALEFHGHMTGVDFIESYLKP